MNDVIDDLENYKVYCEQFNKQEVAELMESAIAEIRTKQAENAKQAAEIKKYEDLKEKVFRYQWLSCSTQCR
jgi:hypothetical protein